MCWFLLLTLVLSVKCEVNSRSAGTGSEPFYNREHNEGEIFFPSFVGSQTTVEPLGTESPNQSGGGVMSNALTGLSCLNVGSSAAGNNGVNEIHFENTDQLPTTAQAHIVPNCSFYQPLKLPENFTDGTTTPMTDTVGTTLHAEKTTHSANGHTQTNTTQGYGQTHTTNPNTTHDHTTHDHTTHDHFSHTYTTHQKPITYELDTTISTANIGGSLEPLTTIPTTNIGGSLEPLTSQIPNYTTDDNLTNNNQSGECVDLVNCRTYIKEKICTKDSLYYAWASVRCRVYCGFCDPHTSPKPCVDAIPNCIEYSKDICTNPLYRLFREDNCQKFCGLCTVAKCARNEFTCDDGQCIPEDQRCDNQLDCRDKTDEVNCTLTNPCPEGQLMCANLQCVPGNRCDGVNDCSDGSDETGCLTLQSGSTISSTSVGGSQQPLTSRGPEYTTKSNTSEDCVDLEDCRTYVKETICPKDSLYYPWASVRCRVYCSFCDPHTSPKPCVDKISNCNEYGADLCTNPLYRLFREDNCQKYCGLCTELVTTTPHGKQHSNHGNHGKRMYKDLFSE